MKRDRSPSFVQLSRLVDFSRKMLDDLMSRVSKLRLHHNTILSTPGLSEQLNQTLRMQLEEIRQVILQTQWVQHTLEILPTCREEMLWVMGGLRSLDQMLQEERGESGSQATASRIKRTQVSLQGSRLATVSLQCQREMVISA